MQHLALPRALGAAAVSFLCGLPASAQQTTVADELPERTKSLGVVTVTGGQPSSLPTQIPTTIEGMTREEIDTRINATDSEDALKYLPSLLVRKRYIGDYNHAILSTRASGTGNSARSAVYADGILLSNYLGNGIANGSNYAPRWGMVSPKEIERVDVMYGPFSAAYLGNSAGAVVDYVTRMPSKFEAHVSAGYTAQPNHLYNTHQTFNSWQTSASLGSKSGDWSWWLSLNHGSNQGQPQTFTTATQASGRPGAAGVPVTGYVAGLNTSNQPWYILGTGTQYQSVQDQAKLKLAYDISPTLRASYTLGWWQNSSQGRSQSYLSGPDGQPIYSGDINIQGNSYTLGATAFPLTDEAQTHVMHGFSLKSHTQGLFDWELAASVFDYLKDQQRAPTVALPQAASSGAGTLQDQNGTGWRTVAAKGTWRPSGLQGAHIVDFGLGHDRYQLAIAKHSVVGNWMDGSVNPAALISQVGGNTQTSHLWAQDSWRFAPQWKAVLGMRWEYWQARNGYTATASSLLPYDARSESHFSPKAALAYQWNADTVLKASLGRSVRFPTVGELYGATSGGALSFVNDPALKPERSWTGELSLEQALGAGLARATLFHETTRDALYSQPIPDSTVSRVQNVDRMRTTGLELAYNGSNVLQAWGLRGVDLGSSLTYAHSKTVADAAYPQAVGKWQPRVPRWRATAWATYAPDAQWSFTVAARYSGKQFSNLDNSDVNAAAYFGASKYFTVDLRVRYRIDRQWSASFGIDNANNDQYWNFHPYPQRTFTASLKWDTP
ncbi:TonB-dependent receptor [Comamonas sp. GB3 AK4-5]|uniref:TonB-dependent receptor n=1 Tax=Comamonas sp. GB3 AK4-5 TaxID=3231487 RepID=UPI00351E5BBD